MHDLARASGTPPASTTVVTAGCPATAGCPWATFLHMVEDATNLANATFN
jgi:hypothetical protein